MSYADQGSGLVARQSWYRVNQVGQDDYSTRLWDVYAMMSHHNLNLLCLLLCQCWIDSYQS